MEKFSLIAIIAVFNLILFIEVTPRSLDASDLKDLSAIADIDTQVRYDGAQLWSVDFVDERTKAVVVGLKRNFG